MNDVSLAGNKPLSELEFLSKDALSIRAIDNAWVRERAWELSGDKGPDMSHIQEVLTEVVQALYERLGHNAADDMPAMLFFPSNELDPYIVGLHINHRTNYQKRLMASIEANIPHIPTKVSAETSLREDFENLLFEEGAVNPNDLDVDENNRYIKKWVKARWEGFMMYHNNNTAVKSASFKNKYNNTLSRYVIGKVTEAGKVVFTAAPYRHKTKALAMEEANRLAAQFIAPFAVFRCLDIIEPPVVV